MDNNFSVAPDDLGQIQNVSAWRAGWLYQGEAVISERWSTGISEPLTGSASFRIVLLTTSAAVEPANLADQRIGVWIPGQDVSHPGKDRHAGPQGVREQAAIYQTARNTQLDNLTRALDRRSAADDERFVTNLKAAFAGALQRRWRVPAVFESDLPANWIAAAGPALSNANYESTGAAAVERLTVDDTREKVAPWLISFPGSAPTPPEALAVGLRQDGQPVEDLIFKLYEGDSLAGNEAHRFLVHDLGYSEYVAALHLLAAVANTGAEIVWQEDTEVTNHSETYLKIHEQNREDAQRARLLMDRAILLAAAKDQLKALSELPSDGADKALDSLQDLALNADPCSRAIDDMDMDHEPYCTECGLGFSVPNLTRQVESSIGTLEMILSRINGYISTSAITEILDGKESPETRKLLRISEASNLDINRATGESVATAFIAEYLRRRGNM